MNTQADSPSENRVKIVSVRPNQILALFHPTAQSNDYVTQIQFPGLPPDSAVTAVNYDWCQNVIQFKVEHSSFDPVPEGIRPPEMLSTCEVFQRKTHQKTKKVKSK